MNKTMNAEAAKLAGLQIDFLQKFRNGSRTLSEFELFLNGKNPFPNYVTPDEVKLTLVITQSTVEQMIAAGKYNGVSDTIVKKFQFDPVTIGTWEFRLVNKGHESSEKAQTFCKEDGWQVGSLEHLLALGAMFPQLQKQNSIIALGSVCEFDGYRRIPGLWYDGDDRALFLDYWSGGWGGVCRFLSVRKISDS